MTSASERREIFKGLHTKGRAFLMPNPFDVGTTRVLTGLEFEALATSSAGFGFGKGFKDVEGLVTRDAALAHAEEIVSATHLPVNGDLENGFGDTPEDVVETIKGAIEVGLSGCSIEDYSGHPDHSYYDLDLAFERIKAAVDVKNRFAPNFILTARSEASIETEHDLEEAIARLSAFATAGADCIYAPAMTQPGQIRKMLARVDVPLNILAGRKDFTLTQKELADLGVARISIGAGLARVAYGAFVAASVDIKSSGAFGAFDKSEAFHCVDAFLQSREKS